MQFDAMPKAVRRLIIISVVFLVVSIGAAAFNAYVTIAAPSIATYVPDTVGFEGQLADGSGQPVSDGDYIITFSLYSVASGGTALWTETQTVSVSDGLYSVQLGSVDALDASDFNGDRWLGVQVSGDSEMTPRIPISAVPFALNAQQAMGLQGHDVSSATPQDGDVLRYQTDQWVPSEPVLPSGTIIMVDGACPTGFSEYTDARGRYVVGVPLNGTVGAAVGTALSDEENRPVGEHTHTITDPGHSHDIRVRNGSTTGEGGIDSWSWKIWSSQSGGMDTATTGITIDNAGDVEGTNAPYIQLRFCEKD